MSNQDLFWAIRGGGGGTFGVVVEATWKAYPAIPITGYNWYINSSITGPDALDPVTGRTPVSDMMQYLMGELPSLQEQGISAFIYVDISHVRCFAVHPGKASDVAKANAIWGPILTEMQSFPNITPFQTKSYTFSNYKEFFDITYGPLENGTRSQPRSHGVFPYESRLLGPEHLRHPDIMDALSGAEGDYGILMTAPGLSQGGGEDTSENPAWRRAVVHLIAAPDASGLRRLAPDMGAYINEVGQRSNSFLYCSHSILINLVAGEPYRRELDPSLLGLQLPQAIRHQIQVRPPNSLLDDAWHQRPSHALYQLTSMSWPPSTGSPHGDSASK